MAAEKYIIVGNVARPHGIRGELCIDSYADSPSYFDRGAVVRLSPPATPGRGRDYTIRTVRVHQERLLVSFDRIPDRTAAEPLRGLAVCVPASHLVLPEPDAIFVHELIGLRVRLASAGPDGPDLGVIEDVRDSGGAELWVIRDTAGHEILFPAATSLVPAIDLDAGLVTIDPPPGLLELYQDGEPAKEGEADASGGRRAKAPPGSPSQGHGRRTAG